VLSPPRITAAQAAAALREQRLAMIEAIAERLAHYPPMNQAELAAMLGIARQRLNRLLKKEAELFSLDSLARIAARAGLSVHLRVARPYRRR